MAGCSIDYTKIMNSAMHQVVKQVLKIVSVQRHCNLLISFSTKNRFVVLPDDLREQYPEKMSIILNNHFSFLVVSDRGFSVTLLFSGVEKNLFVPFNSLIYFYDRDVKFSIEFKNYDEPPEQVEVQKSDISHKIQDEIQKKGKIIYFSQFFKPSSPNDTKNDV